jgi:hypothetical protein
MDFGYSNFFFDLLSYNFSTDLSLRFLKLPIFIIKSINPKSKNDFFDSYMNSDIQIKLIKFSDESDDKFCLDLASCFNLFLSPLFTHEYFILTNFISKLLIYFLINITHYSSNL